jgi:hypothetical protein
VHLFIIARVSDSVKRVYLCGTVHSHLNTNAVLLTNFYLLYMFPQNLSTFRDVLIGKIKNFTEHSFLISAESSFIT